MDYYNKLGVSKSASPEEVKRAYKKLAMRYHPDRGGDQKKFQEINEAYETLKDPAKRQQYDNPQPQQRTYTTSNMNDIFGNFFQQGRRPVRKNPDITINVQVNLEDIIDGKNIIGKYALRSGEEVIATIMVPSGIENGQILQIRGMGENIYPNLPRGDLNARIVVKSHPNFLRDRLHLRTNCSINVLELIVGTTVDIITIKGKKLQLKIPKGTDPGTIMSIPEYGIKDFRTQKIGNLYVEIKGITPKLDKFEDINKVKKLNDEISTST